jgi:hypothetical protein
VALKCWGQPEWGGTEGVGVRCGEEAGGWRAASVCSAMGGTEAGDRRRPVVRAHAKFLNKCTIRCMGGEGN